MKLPLFILLTCLVCPVFGQSQIDTFFIEDFNFLFQVPDNWTLTTMHVGLSGSDDQNVSCKMPLPGDHSWGELIISISEITPEERAERKQSDAGRDTSMIVRRSGYPAKMGGLYVGAGYYEAQPFRDTFLYSDKRGKHTIFKNQRKGKVAESEVHIYSKWYYYPVSDSLEVLVAFRGFIPRSEIVNADDALDRFARFFFDKNNFTLERLGRKIDKEKSMPLILPLDTIICKGKPISFPVLANWHYDTTHIQQDTNLVFLRLSPEKNTGCDNASIEVSYHSAPLDSVDKAKYKKSQVYQSLKVLNSSLVSGENRHFYFEHKSTSSQNKDCDNQTSYDEKHFIIIHTSDNQKVVLTVYFRVTSSDAGHLGEYFKVYSRFTSAFVSANDFEQFYLNNKLK